MQVRAKVNFSGLISMTKGEERELNNEFLLKDLLKAGYIEEVAAPVQQPKKRGAKSNESKRDNE